VVDDLVEVPPEIDRPEEVDELLDEEPPLTLDDLDPPLTDECDPPLNPFASTKFGTNKIIDNTSDNTNLNFIFSSPFLFSKFFFSQYLPDYINNLNHHVTRSPSTNNVQQEKKKVKLPLSQIPPFSIIYINY
jgi:hypothetical protein